MAFSLFPAGCQKIDGSANRTVPTENADESAVIKLCPAKNGSPSTRIDLKRVPHIVHAEFINSDKIWLVTLDKEIYATADAGKTWKKLRLQNGESFAALEFLNEQIGWLADRDHNLWKTTDGGKIWNQIYSFKTAKEQDFILVEEIKFTSPDNGWLRETFGIHQTTDGGKSWKKINQLAEQPREMFFADELHGWIGYKEGSEKSPSRILRTADGGKTWKKGNVQTGNSVESLYFLDDRRGWGGNENNELLATADAGENWSKTNLNVKNFQSESMFWLNSAHGWLAGAIVDADQPVSDAKANTPTLLSTTDGGQSWNKYEMPGDERFFNDVYFTDAANGWLISQKAIYKTTDGGRNWNTIVKIGLSCSQ